MAEYLPLGVVTSTSTVGLPRESKTERAVTAVIDIFGDGWKLDRSGNGMRGYYVLKRSTSIEFERRGRDEIGLCSGMTFG